MSIIVAVHGLQGHWKRRGSTTTGKFGSEILAL